MYLLALLVVLWQLHEKHTDGGGWKLNDDDDDEPAPLRTFIVTASATVSAAATPVVDTRQNRIGSRSRSSSRVNDNGIIIQSSSHIIMTCIMHGISMRDRSRIVSMFERAISSHLCNQKSRCICFALKRRILSGIRVSFISEWCLHPMTEGESDDDHEP